MRAHHHPGASARLDLAYARESAEKEAHHHNQKTKQPNARKPRPRPMQKKRAKRADSAQDTGAHDHVDDIEDVVPDQMPTEFENLYELSENHPRFGHRMNSKRKRGKKGGGGGTGVNGSDSGDDSVESDDYSIGIDDQNAERLADLMLCAGSDDSGGADDNEGTDEERRFERLNTLEADPSSLHAADDKPRTGTTRHPAPTALRAGSTETAGRGVASRPSTEPKATREWAEAALLALVQRNRPDATETLQLVQPAGGASVPRPTRAGKINVLPAAARVMQRFLAHQAAMAASHGNVTATKSRPARPTASAAPAVALRGASRDGNQGPVASGKPTHLPFAATVEAARQRLVDSSPEQGSKPVPRGMLGHEQELFNLTVVLFQLALHTPRLPAQLGVARARRRTLDRRMIGVE